MPADVAQAVEAAIAETGANSPKDFGKVMKAALARLSGKTADGKVVSEAVGRNSADQQTFWRRVPSTQVGSPFPSSSWGRRATEDPFFSLPKSPQIARSAGLIGAATMTSRILGLVREQVMAYLFGAGNAVDAFNVAFRIPNLVRDLFAEGAMSAALVPTFTRYLSRQGREPAWRLGNHVINALLVVTAVLVVAGMVFAHPLVMLLAGDYAAVPGKIELTVLLTRVMLPFLILVAIAAAVMGMLNSLDRYFVPALAPAVFNVRSIACTVAFVPLLAPTRRCQRFSRWRSACLPAVSGSWSCSSPPCGARGSGIEPLLHPAEPGLREVLLLMGPGTLGLAATQINVFVNTWLATGEGTGAVSWLGYAFRLMYLPLGIFGVSIATASLPAIARRAADDDVAGLRAPYRRAWQ